MRRKMTTNRNVLIPEPSEADTKPKFPYMRKITKACSVINMWPNTKNTHFFLYHSVIFLISLIVILFNLSFCIQVVKNFNHLDSVAFLVNMMTVTMSDFLHYLYVCFRGDKYSFLVSLMHSDFIHFSLFPKKNRPSIMKYYKTANSLILGYITFTLVATIYIFLAPICTYFWATSKFTLNSNETAQNPVPLPVIMKSYAPFDHQKQPGNALFYTFQIVATLCCGWIFLSVDCFWCMVIFLTIGQFTLLKESVNTISQIIKEADSTENAGLLKENEIQQVAVGLKHCIRHHQFMRKFVHLLDDVINPNILIDLLHISISSGFIILDVVVGLKNGDFMFLISIAYFTVIISHIFLFDWLGNELNVKEEELAQVLYDMPWHRCPQIKPLILLMSNQARRPCQLTGGRIYKLNLRSFVSMMQAAFSYFTFLRKFRTDAPPN